MKEKPSGGSTKVEEYIARIEGGESKDSIMEGLPPSFVAGIEKGMEEKRLADKVREEEIRKQLGIDQEKNPSIPDLVEYVSKGRKQVVVDLYKNFLDNIDDSESRKKLVSGLFQDVYNKYRISDYPIDINEEKTWEDALKNTKVGVDNRKGEWMYRGVFPKNGEETATRGSFNVNVTPELIGSLDDMIATGKIKANYKFGQPGTSASPTERHDSISIYFLEQPSDEALKELATIIKPHVRGDNLLGKKVEDGFFMSEVGSIEDKHIESFVEALKLKDVAFADSVKGYTSPRPGQGNSLKMSEAQYYAIKDVARAFGYDISYNKDVGFEIK